MEELKSKNVHLIKGDCLEVMDKLIEQGIKVDAIITDVPYGTTNCKWDSVIPFNDMWKRLKLLRNDNTPIILFGSEPFSSALRMSNIKEFKYDWIWDRVVPSGFLNANKMPMKRHEIISVFYKKTPKYNKIYEQRNPNSHSLGESENYLKSEGETCKNVYGGIKDKKRINYDKEKRNPTSIIEFSKGNNKNKLHVTQKPIELMEYLIRTYSNENDTILDFTMGSASTGIASINLNRKFIGIEKDNHYYDVAYNRINGYIYEK